MNATSLLFDECSPEAHRVAAAQPAINRIIAAMVREYRERNPFTRLELEWFRGPAREGVRE